MVIAQVYSFLKNSFAFQEHVVTAEYVRIMRLRILSMLMCKSEVQHPEGESNTHAQLVEYFKTGNVPVTGGYI